MQHTRFTCSISILQECEDSSSSLNKLRRLEPSPLAGDVTAANSAAFATTEPSASQPAPINAQPPSEPSESTELKPSQLNPSVVGEDCSENTPEIAPVLTDEPEEIPIAPPPAPPSAPASVRASKLSTPPARVPTTPSIRATPPAKPVTSSSGYFGIAPCASATSDAENVTNVWVDNFTENVNNPQGQRIVSQKQSLSSFGQPGSSGSTGARAPALQSRKASRGSFQPREREIAVGTYTWSNSNRLGSDPLGFDDPFAAPKVVVQPQSQTVIPAQVVAAVSPADTVHVPEPLDPRSPRDDTMIPAAEPAAMALPPMHEAISSQPSRQPSGYNLCASTSDPMDYFGRSQDDTPNYHHFPGAHGIQLGRAIIPFLWDRTTTSRRTAYTSMGMTSTIRCQRLDSK
ncbi:hypothetical protein EDC04DRAFT_636140 [Pisolithus marmoratus]|nr:hypothetical protein EDC04DRAFT_636140 [Pisolithus marmoratus]